MVQQPKSIKFIYPYFLHFRVDYQKNAQVYNAGAWNDGQAYKIFKQH